MEDLIFKKDYSTSNDCKCVTDISTCKVTFSEEKSTITIYNLPQTIIFYLKVFNTPINECLDRVKIIFNLFNDCIRNQDFENNSCWIDVLRNIKIVELGEVHAAFLGKEEAFIYSNIGENIKAWLDPAIEEENRLKFILDFCIKYNELLKNQKIEGE